MRAAIQIAFLFAIVSCGNKEHELPARTIYGEASRPLMFNVNSLVKDLNKRDLRLEGAELGQVEFVADNQLILFSPLPSFAGQSDAVRLFADGEAIAELTFASSTANDACKTFAPSYDIVLTSGSQNLQELFSIAFCGEAYENRSSPLVEAIDLTPSVQGLSVFSGRGVGFEFTPASELTEVIDVAYTLAYYKAGKDPNGGDLSKYDLVLSGLIRIRPAP